MAHPCALGLHLPAALPALRHPRPHGWCAAQRHGGSAGVQAAGQLPRGRLPLGQRQPHFVHGRNWSLGRHTALQNTQHCIAHSAASLRSAKAVLTGPAILLVLPQELSLLYDCFLSYGYSTVAVACLVLSEWTTKAGAPGGSSAGAQQQPAISAIAALTSVVGVDVTDLAPNLAPCVEALHQLFAQASSAGLQDTEDLSSQLGCLAPVVLRYMQRGGVP